MLGLYYLTIMADGGSRWKTSHGDREARNTFAVLRDIAEVEHALAREGRRACTARSSSAGTASTRTARRSTSGTRPRRAARCSARCCRASRRCPFDVVNKLMTKREISGMIDTVYRHCGQKETVIFCDRIMALGFYHAFKAGISFGKDDMVVPKKKWEIVDKTRAERQGVRAAVQRRPDHPGREVQQGGRRLVEVHRPDRRRDDEGNLGGEEGRGRPRGPGQLDLHDGALRRARLARADAPARRHARPDGEALGRDHREPDHLELQGRPLGARVLQLDARRPQGSRRHRAEDRELGLPDAPSGRRRAGLHHHVGGLRHQGRHHGARHHRRRAPWSLRWRPASSAAPRPRTSRIRRAARSSSSATRCLASRRSRRSSRPTCRSCASARCSPARTPTACAAPATGAILPAARRSTWARRSA